LNRTDTDATQWDAQPVTRESYATNMYLP